MALTAPHFTFLYLCINLCPAIAKSDHITNLVPRDSPHVIKFQNYRIILSAINARMLAQEGHNQTDDSCLLGTPPCCNICYVTSFIVVIPTALAGSFARATL